MKSLLCLLFTFTALQAQPWSGIIDPARAVDWSGAGVVGGIPTNYTQCVNTQCQAVTTAGSSATAAQINSAIANAPANTYVFLGAGTYNLSAGINIPRSNVILRGAGANQTLLNFSGSQYCFLRNALVCIKSSSVNYNFLQDNSANWTAGYAKGTTQITLDSHTNLKVGTPLILDQANDTTDDGTVYICNTGSCALSGASGFERSGRAQEQVVTVASCGGSTTYGTACTSNTITISPAIVMPNWRSGQTPQAWWSSTPLTGVGIENLQVSQGTQDANSIMFMNANNSWIRGVSSIRTTVYQYNKHLSAYECNHITVRDNYLYGPGGQNTSYGIEFAPSNDSLAENNIIQAVAEPLTPSSSITGTVFSYNFSVNMNFTANTAWMNQQLMLHSVIDSVLYEGNIGAGIYGDNFHGSHHFITAFRNRLDGYESNNGTNPTQHTNPVIIYPYNRFFNMVGNVLGSTGRAHTNYITTACTDQTTIQHTIYILGYNDQSCPGTTPDSAVAPSTMLWENYDVVTNAVRACTGASTPSAFCTGDERGDTAAGYPALTSPSLTLPNSFVYTAQPAWYPTTVGGVTMHYPPIGPDVTSGNIGQCAGGTYAGFQALSSGQCTGGSLTSSIVGGHAYANPAMACYLNVMSGPPDGTGSALSFNAASCYPTPSVRSRTARGSGAAVGGGLIR